ncbi:MAG: hypothetical protein IJ848_01530 [Alphaproteobacteria bacterium]|nr:hypothetical protein [Alphaproteobacteria bacterium]
MNKLILTILILNASINASDHISQNNVDNVNLNAEGSIAYSNHEEEKVNSTDNNVMNIDNGINIQNQYGSIALPVPDMTMQMHNINSELMLLRDSYLNHSTVTYQWFNAINNNQIQMYNNMNNSINKINDDENFIKRKLCTILNHHKDNILTINQMSIQLSTQGKQIEALDKRLKDQSKQIDDILIILQDINNKLNK